MAVCFEVRSPQRRELIHSVGAPDVLGAQAARFALALCPTVPSEDHEKVRGA